MRAVLAARAARSGRLEAHTDSCHTADRGEQDRGEQFTSRRQVYRVMTWRKAIRRADLGAYRAGSSAQAIGRFLTTVLIP